MPPIQVFAYLGKQNNLTCIWLTYPIKLIEMPFGVMYFSVDIFTFIFRFWLLMYTTPHCCCIKNFLRSLHKKHTKNTKIIGGGGQYSPLRVMTHWIWRFATKMQILSDKDLSSVFFIKQIYFFKYCFSLWTMVTLVTFMRLK